MAVLWVAFLLNLAF
ncbi:hypothetical protein LBRM_03_0710 [Leishmania braziliensis MHOM/BR/75/M2904]|uniref:Uncharacterized protein n=2 Tax=Leishmania braziliensis TaxID=5660 RepID=A4H3P2_LEIBR|nr:hypothetical protein LBRM_03_0710 [Leishmania braziliensis MHOM/BR/75/M2904]CAM36807.1 hypothetical protein LBRM_03_0710 [Leishmania braziliensis MHOM/BR/75/M2904]